MSIATRTGDAGTTGLLRGQRVPKDHPQIEALGAFDQANVEVGGARMLASGPVRDLLASVQTALVAVMGEVACAEEDAQFHANSKLARIGQDDLDRLDRWVADLEGRKLKLDGWATPGANPSALAFDRARVATRCAERRLASLSRHGRTPRPLLGQWTNRLSDVLWLLARSAEAEGGASGA